VRFFSLRLDGRDNYEVMWEFLAAIVVYRVYKRSGLKGLKMDQATPESTTALKLGPIEEQLKRFRGRG